MVMVAWPCFQARDCNKYRRIKDRASLVLCTLPLPMAQTPAPPFRVRAYECLCCVRARGRDGVRFLV